MPALLSDSDSAPSDDEDSISPASLARLSRMSVVLPPPAGRPPSLQHRRPDATVAALFAPRPPPPLPMPLGPSIADQPSPSVLQRPQCIRCSRTGHTVEACIARHDSNGTVLEPLPQVVYLARRAAYLALHKPPQHPVATVADSAPALPDDSDSDVPAVPEMTEPPVSTVQAILNASDPETSDVEECARSLLEAPIIASIAADTEVFLQPPKFHAFLVAPSTPMPPPMSSHQVCAVDTMCQGKFSIISKDLVTSHTLPCRPHSRTCRTANGAKVTCTHMALFVVALFINGAWMTLPTQALVWDQTAEPILLSNDFALRSGLIDFVQPNSERIRIFGAALFSSLWHDRIANHDAAVLAAYHEDVLDEATDDLIDMSAPLKLGDQDVSALPPDAQAYARRFPIMTKAIPRDAHPSLEKWRAHVHEDQIPLYSWPVADLKDLKEDKLPFKHVPLLHGEFDKLISLHYVEELRECPTGLCMKAQLVSKSKTEKRFCVNGSMQKLVMEVGVYPMPQIRAIFCFVSSFAWRAKLDCKHGYHNFEVHPEDRKFTCTIGAGRAVQWRKLVQGFASSGSFFQYALCKLLGPAIVFKTAAVYLDDIIVVGNSPDECRRNVDAIMEILHSVGFRINFAKCAFTPSNEIEFLGCRMVGTFVHPGPKVSTMLSRIKAPHLQHTPKSQRHHLHVFLGMCAFVMNHCPGLKVALSPLYTAVASEPFRYGALERQTFDKCHAMLSNLQPYHLPSDDPLVHLELMSDASGGLGTAEDPGHWGVALGQRTGPTPSTNLADGFDLLLLEGGTFNARQASWDILKKEAKALIEGLKRLSQYIYGRRLVIIVDSRVLLHIFRSSSPMLQRWYAYLQTFDFEMRHVASDENPLADCLSRCVAIPPPPAPSGPRLLRAIDNDIPAVPLTQQGVEPNPGPRSDDEPLVTTISSDSSPEPPMDSRTAVAAITRARSGGSVATPALPVPAHKGIAPQAPAPAAPAQAATALPANNVALPPRAPRPRRNIQPKAVSAPIPPAQHDLPLAATEDIASPATSAPAAPAASAPKNSAARRPRAAPLVEAPPAREAVTAPPRRSRRNTQAPQAAADAQPQGAAAGPRAASPPAPALPLFEWRVVGHSVSDTAQSFCEAFSEALANEAAVNPIDAPPTISTHSADMRDCVLRFMRFHRNTPLVFLEGQSFSAAFRSSFIDSTAFLSFDNVEQLHQPQSWEEYLTLLAQPSTFPDALFVRAAAMLYKCQLVVVDQDLAPSVLAPPSAFRRVLLFHNELTEHYNWGHDVAEPCNLSADCAGNDAVPLSFQAPVLEPFHEDDATRNTSLNDDTEISASHHRLILSAHCGFTGHPGVQATYRSLVDQGHKWKGMTAQIAQFIRRCPTCLSSRIALNKAPVSASTLRLHARPLCRWHVDQTGNIGDCAFTGFSKIIAFICETTGFAFLFGTRFGTALEIAIAFIHVMGLFGLAESFHSDHGKENDAYIIHQLQQITGLKHTFSIPYNPSTNGIVERNIGTAKRFLSTLCIDIGKHNAWGLMLPIAQKGMNDLKREELGWFCPNEVVFASLYVPDTFVIPTFYGRRVNESDLVDSNLYQVGGNFAHRIMCFQQLVTNKYYETLDRAFEAAIARNPSLSKDVNVGQCVLIDWPNQQRPSATHPLRQGPYRVVAVQRNVLSLEHLQRPPPLGQRATCTWSKHANVYFYCDDTLPPPARSADDPSASQMPLGESGRQIDCVISHVLKQDFDRQPGASVHSRFHVSNQMYECRLWSFAKRPSAQPALVRPFNYDEIKHTFAFDSYAICHPFLTGHVPVAHMPLNWNPHAVTMPFRPAYPPGPAHEREFPADNLQADELLDDVDSD